MVLGELGRAGVTRAGEEGSWAREEGIVARPTPPPPTAGEAEALILLAAAAVVVVLVVLVVLGVADTVVASSPSTAALLTPLRMPSEPREEALTPLATTPAVASLGERGEEGAVASSPPSDRLY